MSLAAVRPPPGTEGEIIQAVAFLMSILNLDIPIRYLGGRPMNVFRGFALAALVLLPQAAGLPDQIHRALSRNDLRDARIGLLVYSTRAGAPVCGRDEKKVLRLASNSKVFVTAAAVAL